MLRFIGKAFQFPMNHVFHVYGITDGKLGIWESPSMLMEGKDHFEAQNMPTRSHKSSHKLSYFITLNSFSLAVSLLVLKVKRENLGTTTITPTSQFIWWKSLLQEFNGQVPWHVKWADDVGDGGGYTFWHQYVGHHPWQAGAHTQTQSDRDRYIDSRRFYGRRWSNP